MPNKSCDFGIIAHFHCHAIMIQVFIIINFESNDLAVASFN